MVFFSWWRMFFADPFDGAVVSKLDLACLGVPKRSSLPLFLAI
jgi:hypothetical protein